MGASLITQAAMTQQQTVIHATPREKKRPLIMPISCETSPEYRFDHFVVLCEECQRKKRTIEAKLTTTMERIRITSNLDGHATAEQKHYVMSLINRYREIQEEQNALVEREKLRLAMMRNELGSKASSVRKLRNRLKYVISLNKDHENIITHIEQNKDQNRSNSNADLRLRFRTNESDDIRL